MFFLNKMDKRSADEKKAIDSIEQKLGVKSKIVISGEHFTDFSDFNVGFGER